MVRSVRKRLGHSRKAQITLFAAYVVAGVGALVGLLLAIFSVADPKGFADLRLAGQEMVAPMARGLRSAGTAVSGIDDAVVAYFRAGSQNRALKQTIADNQNRLITAQILAEENRRLRALLELAERDTPIVATAYLLSSSSASNRRIAMLSVGRNRNVDTDMPVRTGDGLIGRVLNSSATLSRVLLLSDRRSAVPVRRVRDGLPAVVHGLGDGRLDVKTLTVAHNPFSTGDILVTTGLGGIYPPNIPVAVITERTEDSATAQPLALPASSDIVAVLAVYAPPPAEETVSQ